MCIDAASTAAVQEMHLIALHVMCETLDESLDRVGLAQVAAL
jgi:D-sedoheptulose 7-phosphate isomerase